MWAPHLHLRTQACIFEGAQHEMLGQLQARTRPLRNCLASPIIKGIESPSARVGGRHWVAPIARLGLRECQNIPQPASAGERE